MTKQWQQRRGRSDTDGYDAPAHHEPEPATVAALPTLIVGRADDPAEAAADRMADAALSRLRAPHLDGATSHDLAEAQDWTAHRALDTAAPGGAIGAAGGAADAATAELIGSSRGRPLSGPTRGRMESAFGRSFGEVRIHDGSAAAQASAAISASAFTRGHDIYFGRGQFDPDSPAGEHLLAHELAHVAQGGRPGHAQRFFGFGKPKDPAKIAAAQKAKEEKAEKKRIEKQAKSDKKAEDKRLKEERTRGVAGRAGLSDKINAPQIGLPGQEDPGTAWGDINQRFAAALAEEQQLFDRLSPVEGEEAARKSAYKTVWLDTKDEELRSIRPMRETAAERLVSAVHHTRNSANVRAMMDEKPKHGTLLTPSVELVYDMFVIEADRLMGPPMYFDLDGAMKGAAMNVWDLDANAAAKKSRPEPGSPVDRQAIKDARIRQNLHPNPPQKKPVDGLDEGIAAGEAAGSIASPAGTAIGGVSSILGALGKDKTSKMQEDAGFVKKPDGTSGGLDESLPGGVGDLVVASKKAKFRVDNGLKDDEPQTALPKSVETKASEGISSSVSVLQELLASVQNLMKFAKSVQKANSTTNPRSVMAATKAGADSLSSVAKTGKSAADLAKTISPGVTQAVGSVIPGFNIFITVMSMVSAAMSMGERATRVQDTEESLFAARERGVKGGDGPDVMVYPILRAMQSYTKSLEQAVWNTAIAISDFATGVATVATGGGFGIPVAVQAGVKVIDLLHSIGHFIADEVLVQITKKAQKDSIGKLEGSAERQLERDPAMAVDGIIIAAASGDVIAQAFLANYEVDGAPIDATILSKIKPDPANVGDERIFTKVRGAVLGVLGEEADAQSTYEKFSAKAKGVKDAAAKHTTGKWAAIGQLAEDRNELGATKGGKSNRGFGWKLKMMFKGTEKLDRSRRRTRVEMDDHRGPSQGGAEVSDEKILAICGDIRLLVHPTEQMRQIFVQSVMNASDNDLEKAMRDKRNNEEAQKFFYDILQDRYLEKAGV